MLLIILMFGLSCFSGWMSYKSLQNSKKLNQKTLIKIHGKMFKISMGVLALSILLFVLR